MTHLTSDELIDAVEGTLASSRRDHLAACATCTREVAELTTVLREAREVEIPEPSPLFWDHLSARVRTAVDADASLARRSFSGAAFGGRSFSEGRWLRWPVLAPIGALALIVLALMTAIPRQAGPEQQAPGSASADIPLNEDGWMLVADLVGDLDWDTADAAGVMVRPGTAEQAALELSAQEQMELGRLIKAELERVKS